MSKIFKALFKKGQEAIKQTAGELAQQNIENLKFKANEKMTEAVNNTIQNISTGLISGNMKKESSDENLVESSRYQDAAYRDGEAFENNLREGLEGMVSSLAAGNPEEAREVFNNLITMAGEVQKFTEVQKTKRKEIEAERDIVVERIKSHKEILLSYLEKSFDERKDNFTKLFSIVDNAIENNNMQQLALGLDSINKLADSSPFKALASIEDTKLALEDKNQEWDF
jgi:hypothetical protein